MAARKILDLFQIPIPAAETQSAGGSYQYLGTGARERSGLVGAGSNSIVPKNGVGLDSSRPHSRCLFGELGFPSSPPQAVLGISEFPVQRRPRCLLVGRFPVDHQAVCLAGRFPVDLQDCCSGGRFPVGCQNCLRHPYQRKLRVSTITVLQYFCKLVC